jgi:ketosteroid isomerase-like protein
MHSSTRSTLLTCLVVALAAGCARDTDEAFPPAGEPAGSPATADATMPPELANRVEQYTAAWNGSDPAAVAEYFAEDATARIADETYTGRQEIQAGWLQNVPTISNLAINETTFEQRGQDYYSAGTYTHDPIAEGPTAGNAGGRYSVTWTRAADGQWRIRSSEVMPDAQPQT